MDQLTRKENLGIRPAGKRKLENNHPRAVSNFHAAPAPERNPAIPANRLYFPLVVSNPNFGENLEFPILLVIFVFFFVSPFFKKEKCQSHSASVFGNRYRRVSNPLIRYQPSGVAFLNKCFTYQPDRQMRTLFVYLLEVPPDH